ncbi:hypothetical protein Tco_1246161 [Tanacetum coccineum]
MQLSIWMSLVIRGGVDPATNMASMDVDSIDCNDIVIHANLGDFVSVRCEGATTATTSRGKVGVKRGRGGKIVRLRVRRVTSGSTSSASGRGRGRDGQTLGVRYGRLGRWFGLGDETQKEPNNQPTPLTQQ